MGVEALCEVHNASTCVIGCVDKTVGCFSLALYSIRAQDMNPRDLGRFDKSLIGPPGEYRLMIVSTRGGSYIYGGT